MGRNGSGVARSDSHGRWLSPACAHGLLGDKHTFLVAYDYGMGGLWGLVLARSAREIQSLYPELGIAYERPSWMTDEVYEQIRHQELHDIDDPPSGILAVLLSDRRKSQSGG